MLVINPWDVLAHDGAGIAELREAVSGEVVRTVRYVVPQGEEWPEGHREDRAHEVDMAIELSMESGAVLVLSWAMDGFNEGVAIEFRHPEESSTDLPGDPIDVSGHADWRNFLGVPITGIKIAWHIPNEGCPEMPWSYNFDFSDGSSLVFALGEAEGAGFTYMPDSLLVIFDESIAAAYKIPASTTSSRG
ncbi:hypothetical protein [Streptomyces sp. ST2-7A]|uniref:hypothetical protein n=1 Tax=Streptomyces sp. ST2-7A TaxID=2907214 RepID=UPI001F32F558|nr:hypothetical protein [Streptomyces sp. ST2-7A]MCE7080656.1 hypothetical protein [Streptomyces sp. ST2-7A]